MELDERKTVILKVIIKSYLETGEPVGSRTISKLSGLNLSSATIRNEMSDLVEMGYIAQPHTSAGRIPTDKGYRFYVDSIMQENDRKITAVTDKMMQRVDKLEMLLKAIVKSLASDTNYAALISGPSTATTKIKYLQLSIPGDKQVLLMLVLDGNVIKNELINTAEHMDYETAMRLTVMMNNYLSGLSLREITPQIITDIMVQAGDQSTNVKYIIDAIVDMLEQGDSQHDIFTSGAKNIFKYPELTEIDKAAELISAFEEKDKLNDLVNEVTSLSVADGTEAGNIRVYIGGEGPVKNMKDCSLITANYEIGEGMTGVIGVIGPKRMDYEKVMKALQNLKG
ncbi:MAG: heat-inducible transcriptional repressor HrcA, partial [Eubacteriales bacterium]|nr:heat-inducible transcriptional repressor HrcA [Eubacteriales bacterium]